LTPVHAAPAILEGGDPSPTTDVYALGSTVYTLLAGSPPFAGPPGQGMLAQLLRITTSDLPALVRADVPPSLMLALREATAKHPEDRTPTAVAFGRLLQMVQDDLGLSRTTLALDVPADVPVTPRASAGGAGVAVGGAGLTNLGEPLTMGASRGRSGRGARPGGRVRPADAGRSCREFGRGASARS